MTVLTAICVRCYTVYEKQCKYVNEPQCMTNLREKCENHPVKSCRDVDKFEDVVSGGYLHLHLILNHAHCNAANPGV